MNNEEASLKRRDLFRRLAERFKGNYYKSFKIEIKSFFSLFLDSEIGELEQRVKKSKGDYLKSVEEFRNIGASEEGPEGKKDWFSLNSKVQDFLQRRISKKVD